MAVRDIVNVNFNQGELGDYMEGRSDLKVYASGVSLLENFLPLPQGPIQRRKGFEYIDTTNITDPTGVRLYRFDFQKEQQYALVFYSDSLKIYRDKALQASVDSPYQGSEVQELRFAQSGDTLIITHYDHQPYELIRNGSDTSWILRAITFNALSFFKFARSEKFTPSATTGSITITASGSDTFFNAGHAESVQVKLNGGRATITSFVTAAGGGTALASAGTAANAFDTNTATVCSAGVDGWVGYQFSVVPGRAMRVIGFQPNVTQTFNIVVETDDNASFTSPTEIGVGIFTADASEVTWMQVPGHTAEKCYRIRETGGASLDLKEIYFADGTVVNATVNDTLDNTSETRDFTEQFWGQHRGYPRSVSFLQNRLFFGGVRDQPQTVAASKDSDVYNFDDTGDEDDRAFVRTISSDQSHFIRNLVADRQGLAVLTSDGEFFMSFDSGIITPTNANVRTHSTIGCSTVQATRVDDAIVYSSANGKEVLSFSYSFTEDSYRADSKTTLAHHIFTAGKEPRGLAALRNYTDTQSRMLFVPRNDGEMAVLTLDATKDVQAWSRFITYNPDGSKAKFLDAVTVETDHNGDGDAKPTLYVLVQRNVNGADTIFVEALTEEEVYLDHWYFGESETAKTDWSNLNTLKNETVTVVADTYNAGDQDVNNDGEFTLSEPASEIYAGLNYVSRCESLRLTLLGRDGPIRGKQMVLKEAIVDLLNTKSLRLNGYAVPFRSLGPNLLDAPLEAFSGTKRVKVSNRGSGIQRDPTFLIEVEEPVACTIQTLTVVVRL